MKIRGACGAVSALTLETRGNLHGVGESAGRWVTEERRRSVCVPGGPLASGAKRRARGVSRGWGVETESSPGGENTVIPKAIFLETQCHWRVLIPATSTKAGKSAA